MNLLELPFDVLYEIMGYLSYDEISKNRIVSRQFNELCKQVLDSGYKKVRRQKSDVYRRIFYLLPPSILKRGGYSRAAREEMFVSLANHLELLSLAYEKYLKRTYSCIIPGKLLDEVMCVIKLISKLSPLDSNVNFALGYIMLVMFQLNREHKKHSCSYAQLEETDNFNEPYWFFSM